MPHKVFVEFESIIPLRDGSQPRVFVDALSVVAVTDSANASTIYCVGEANWTVQGTPEDALAKIGAALEKINGSRRSLPVE